jgi:hypothetical protein
MNGITKGDNKNFSLVSVENWDTSLKKKLIPIYQK